MQKFQIPNTMKRALNFVAIVATFFALSSCAPSDVARINPEQNSYTVSASGGELAIPVSSTGIDEIYIDYRESYYEWETDENGDKTPAKGWLTVKSITNNNRTRELPSFSETITLTVEPNTGTVDRQVTLTIQSFNAKAYVTITQLADLPGKEE